MLNNYRNSNIQGNVGLGVAMAYFTKLGYIISTPLNDSQDYDLIVDDHTRLYKVQVKTVYHQSTSGFYEVELRTRTSRGKGKDFGDNKSDYLFIYTNDGDEYLIPCDRVQSRTSLTLGSKYSEYKI